MYYGDVAAGVVMVLSTLFILISIAGYMRYRAPALLINILTFSIMLLDSVIYALNSLYSLNLDMLFILLASDSVILVTMYLAISLKR